MEDRKGWFNWLYSFCSRILFRKTFSILLCFVSYMIDTKVHNSTTTTYCTVMLSFASNEIIACTLTKVLSKKINQQILALTSTQTSLDVCCLETHLWNRSTGLSLSVHYHPLLAFPTHNWQLVYSRNVVIHRRNSCLSLVIELGAF